MSKLYLNTDKTEKPWTLSVNQSGTFEIDTKNTYVDRKIEVKVPKGIASFTPNFGNLGNIEPGEEWIEEWGGIPFTTGKIKTSGWLDANSETTYYLTELTVPKESEFHLYLDDNNTNNYNNAETVYITEGKFRDLAVYTDGVISVVPNSGEFTHTVVCGGFSQSHEDEYRAKIINNGTWVRRTITPSISRQGPFYGETIVGPMAKAVVSDNIITTNSPDSNGVPFIITPGYIENKYIRSIQVDEGQKITLTYYSSDIVDEDDWDAEINKTWTFNRDSNGDIYVT